MKTTFASLCVVLLTAACGAGVEAGVDADALPPIDESACSKERLEADGRDSALLEALPKGQYVVGTTYLRLPLSRRAVDRFRQLSQAMEADLRANPGLLRVVTRTAGSCNTARTLSVWKTEADMYRFVGSASHARAMAAVGEVSRGGSVTTHWNASETEATWEIATRKLAEDNDGPVY
ncbi:MAG: hypothetical protein INH41_07560 [Myxococcaceae bacterium]|jgi:hypothetical protein|nr:hypothetical protein [Myxococcaceae bacterium]MCA3012241.1 hypothetical protein [Myxococcaceae bacterium]